MAVVARAWRAWRRAKGVALCAMLALAVGIGSTTAIYTVVHGVMAAPLPYAHAGRFVALFGASFDDPLHYSAHPWPDLVEYQQRTTSFDVFGWFRFGFFNLVFQGEPHHVTGAAVTPALAAGIGVSPLIGRWFTDDSGAVISHRLWRRLGGDPAIIGQGLTLDGRRLTVTGVMPPQFRLPLPGPGEEGLNTDVWTALDPSGRGQARNEGMYFAYARRKAGITLEQARADAKRAAAEIARLDPAAHRSYTARVDDLRETVVGPIRPTLLLLFAAAALLLLITCANVAGLLIARSVSRARETATRIALGASAPQLALEYVVETSCVSLAGALAGVGASIALVRVVMSLAADYIPRAEEITVDWTVFGFALGAAFFAGVVSSLAPLWQALATAPADVLTGGARTTAGPGAGRLSRSLVAGEIGLAFTLLAVSTLLIGELRSLRTTSPGFDANELLAFRVTIPDSIARRDETRVPYHKRLIEALSAIPGVANVASTNQLPLAGCCLSGTIHPEGRPIPGNVVERTVTLIVSPAYFPTMRIPLLAGRLLTDADNHENPLHVVINQTAAARYWPHEDPIGAYGRFGRPDGDRFQIVGIVGDVRHDGLGKPVDSEIYVLSSIAPANPLWFAVRSPLPGDRLLPAIRRAVRGVDPTLAVYDAASMRDIVDDSMRLERLGSLMTTFFAGAALLMAALGIYGVVSYTVRQRRVEIGTRMALGAVSRDVLALVIGGGLAIAGRGVAAGLVAAIASVWLLARFFPMVRTGWVPFAVSLGVIVVVATVASWLPAWRASRLSPMVALRDN